LSYISLVPDECFAKMGISERDIPGHVRQIAPKFQDGIRAFADSPIIGEVCISLSELPNLPRGQRLLLLFKYMTTLLLYCRYVA